MKIKKNKSKRRDIRTTGNPKFQVPRKQDVRLDSVQRINIRNHKKT